jgi:tetratricopeptide (TPR) repeat protein
MRKVCRVGLSWQTIPLCLLLVGFLVARALTAAEARRPSGVVLEKVGPALQKAGIQPGDIIWGWRRSPSSPTSTENRVAPIDSVFDWWWLAIEQAPRGALELIGQRGTEEKTFVVGSGLWDDAAWPSIPQLNTFRKKAEEYTVAEKTKEVDRWWEEKAAQAQPWHVRSWLWWYLGWLRGARGAWAEGYTAYSAAIADAQDPYTKSLLWREEGELYENHNELDDARRSYLKARLMQESLSEQEKTLGLALVLGDLGRLARKQGNLDEAEHLFQCALQIRQNLAYDGFFVAWTLNHLGTIAGDRGQLDRAEDLVQRSSRLFEEIAPNSRDLALSFNNLGWLAYGRRDLDKAAEFFERALEILRVIAPRSVYFTQSLDGIATVAATRGSYR